MSRLLAIPRLFNFTAGVERLLRIQRALRSGFVQVSSMAGEDDATHGHRGALFDQQASTYAQFRPRYPAQLFERLYSLGTSGTSLAVDVATGTGQVAVELCKTFAQVIACDSSAGQLQHAEQRPNIRYVLCPAERISEHVPAQSADLITVSLALHWFDQPRFYEEARRVLKPDGLLAIWGYTAPFFARLARSPGTNTLDPGTTAPGTKPPGTHDRGASAPRPDEALAQANRLIHDFCFVLLDAYWDPGRKLLDAEYRGLEPSGAQFGSVVREEMRMEQEMSLDAYIGFLSSWSAYTTYRKQHPDRADPLVDLRARLRRLLGVVNDAAPVLRLAFPVFLLLIRKPVPMAVAGQGR